MAQQTTKVPTVPFYHSALGYGFYRFSPGQGISTAFPDKGKSLENTIGMMRQCGDKFDLLPDFPKGCVPESSWFYNEIEKVRPLTEDEFFNVVVQLSLHFSEA